MTKSISTLTSKGTQQSLITIIGNIASAVFAAISIVLISRRMGPELFGEFSAGFALVLILNKINDLGISLATHKLIGETTDRKSIVTFSNSILKIKLTISLILILALLPFSSTLTNLLSFSNPLTAPIAIVLGMSIVYYEYLISLLQSVHSFLNAVLANFSQSFLKFLIALLFTMGLVSDPIQVFSLYILVPIIPFVLYKIFLPRWLVLNPFLGTKKAQKTIISFARFTALTVLSLTVMENVGVLFVKSFHTDFEAGILGGISRIALLFSLVGISLSQVLNPRVSRYTNKHDIDTFIKKSLLVLFGSIFAYILLLPFTSLLINILLGSDYLSGQYPLMVLLSSVFISIATVPFSALFFSFNRKSYFLIIGLLQIGATIIGNYLFVPGYGVMGSVVTQLITRIVALIFTFYFAYSTYKKIYSA